MGWGDCGVDSKNRPIGYLHEGTCDEPGCEEKIDRGLSYACGGMHGVTEYSCEGYFCPKHKTKYIYDEIDNVCTSCGEGICQECGGSGFDSTRVVAELIPCWHCTEGET